MSPDKSSPTILKKTWVSNYCGKVSSLYRTLAWVAAVYDGDHVEIGTRYGKSAIVVAKIRSDYTVYCIDPLETLKPNKEYGLDEIASYNELTQNLKKFNVTDNVKVYRTFSLPFPIHGKRFVSALIDGSHLSPTVLQEWYVLCEIVDAVIVFDNANLPGVDEAINAAKADPRWVVQYVDDIVAYAWNVDYHGGRET